MQNMKRPLASRSLHSHGAAGASKLLVYSEHCLAINYTIFGRIPGQQFSKAEGYANFRAFLSLHCSSAVRKLLFPRELCR